jgi:hypothetical protein
VSTVDADLEVTETPARAPGAELTEARVARVGDMTVRRLLPLRLRRSEPLPAPPPVAFRPPTRP